jgi:hypothetical protein
MGNIIAAAIALSKTSLKLAMLVAVALVISGAEVRSIPAGQLQSLEYKASLLKDVPTMVTQENCSDFVVCNHDESAGIPSPYSTPVAGCPGGKLY